MISDRIITTKSKFVFFCSILFWGYQFPFISASTPHASRYFQQYVNYKLDVQLDITRHRLMVDESLLYINCSPDTLKEIYFHLYLNKYRAHSLFSPDLKTDLGGITIFSIRENDSLRQNYSIDETLMKLVLNHSLVPGDSVRFLFNFAATIPPASDRYGYQGYHYDIGNWYITPVVFDRAGWHLHQHLDNEFYQEWGDYLVQIKVPSEFVIGATGNLINKTASDSLSGTGTQISREAGEMIPDKMTTWKFEAKCVHDFAWTTDPSYVLLQTEWNGITLNVLVMDYNHDSWQQVTDWGVRGLEYFSKTFGPYPYQQMTIADTYIQAGGIEYPQIVMINDYINPDYDPGDFRSLVLHEMAHNWFYGLLANNQTEEEWMDEGFATFAEIKAMEALFGKKDNLPKVRHGWIQNKTAYRNDDLRDNAYHYLRWAKFNFDRDPISLHSDRLGDDGYMLQYSKMAMVLFMLEYTLGDSVFALAMQDYFNQWHFRHPYGQDFIAVMETRAGRDLDWFFEQWLNTNDKLDYAVTGHEGKWDIIDTRRVYKCRVHLERKNDISMPVDFRVTLKDGSVQWFQIPVDNSPKPVPERVPLPYWHFSQKEYTANLTLTSEVDKVEIDTIMQLVDVNSLNNSSSFLPEQEFHWMRYQSNAPPLGKYMWEVWPLFFYNDYDKIKAGVRMKGGYLDIDHKLDARVWYKTASTSLDVDLDYSHPLNWMGYYSWFNLQLYHLDGRQGAMCGLVNPLSRHYSRTREFAYGMTAHQVFNTAYLMAPWDKGNITTLFFNFRSSTNFTRSWKKKFYYRIDIQNSFLGSDHDFSQVFFEAKRTFWNSRSDWECSIRLFLGHSQGDVPAQYLFNLAGDNGWGEFNESFYRSKGSLPYAWRRNGHLYKAGGGNVRGSSITGKTEPILGKKIAAINLDVLIPNPLRFTYVYLLRDLELNAFLDVGSVWDRTIPGIEQLQKTAGIGLVWPANRWMDFLFGLKNIRFDLPFWIGNTGSGVKHTRFRWLVSFNFE